MSRAELTVPDLGFQPFVERIGGRLYAHAYFLVPSGQEAQDLVQESLLRLWRRWDQVSKYEDPEAWAHRVLSNLASNSRRKARRRSRVERQAWTHSESQPSLDAGHVDLVNAINRLPNSQRRALVLHDVLGWPVAEVAEAMNCPEGSVRAWLSRARRRLEREMATLRGETESGESGSRARSKRT